VRERITVLRNNYTISSTGQRSTDGSATEIGTYYATARKVTDDQDMIAGYNTVEDIWEFKLRNQDQTLTTKDIVRWEGNKYQVIGISDQSGYKRFIKLKCSFINPNV